MKTLPCNVKVGESLTLRAGTDVDLLLGVLERQDKVRQAYEKMSPAQRANEEAMTRNLQAMLEEKFGIQRKPDAIVNGLCDALEAMLLITPMRATNSVVIQHAISALKAAGRDS